MTDAELMRLVEDRKQSLAELSGCLKSLRRMGPAVRLAYDRTAARFRDRDREITAEMRRRGEPARLPAATLWLTADRLNFVELDPATGRPPGFGMSHIFAESCLYEYPTAIGGAA